IPFVGEPAQVAANPVRAGYAIVTPAAGSDLPQTSMSIYHFFGTPAFVSTVNPTAAPLSTRYKLPTVINSGQTSGIAIVNPGSSAITITATLKTARDTTFGTPVTLT